MNKAEEQYLYEMGKAAVKNDILEWGWHNRNTHKFTFGAYLKEYCQTYIDKNKKGDGKYHLEYLSTIIRLIDNNVITDWPSFVTYMTGETYE